METSEQCLWNLCVNYQSKAQASLQFQFKMYILFLKPYIKTSMESS